MIRTRALELQGGRASGAWKVRLGAGIPSVSILPQLIADKLKGCPCRWVKRHPGPLVQAGIPHGIEQVLSPRQYKLVGARSYRC